MGHFLFTHSSIDQYLDCPATNLSKELEAQCDKKNSQVSGLAHGLPFASAALHG